MKMGDEGETWLEQFPAALVAVLADLEDARVSKIATAWGQTEEINSPGAELRPIVHDLRRLAVSARRFGKAMYLWGSL